MSHKAPELVGTLTMRPLDVVLLSLAVVVTPFGCSTGGSCGAAL